MHYYLINKIRSIFGICLWITWHEKSKIDPQFEAQQPTAVRAVKQTRAIL